MAEERKSRKVRYTEMVVRDSLLELLNAKPLEKITVTEICRLADINRGTFYLHYTDVWDLFGKLEEELLLSIRESTESESPPESEHDALARILEAIRERGDVWVRMTGEHGDPDFLAKLFLLAQERIRELGDDSDALSEERLGYVFAYGVHGASAAVGLWIQNGYRETPSAMASILVELLPEHFQQSLRRLAQ